MTRTNSSGSMEKLDGSILAPNLFGGSSFSTTYPVYFPSFLNTIYSVLSYPIGIYLKLTIGSNWISGPGLKAWSLKKYGSVSPSVLISMTSW